MKVTLEKNYKELYTIADLDAAKLVIRYEKDNDDWTPAKWAYMAICEADKDHCYDVITATATTAKNGRIWNAYGDGTGRMDVWIEAVGECYAGYIKIGAYLSDIWETGATAYAEHMYIRRATFDDR